MLQSWWQMLCNLASLRSESTIKMVWMVVVIIHNMIVKDEEVDVDFDN
jgi:hypothetical protein